MLACVAPGPRVTKQIPGRPVSLPSASAMLAAAPSCLATIDGDLRRVIQRVEHIEIAFAGDAEQAVDAVDAKRVDEDPPARAGSASVGHWPLYLTSTAGGVP